MGRLATFFSVLQILLTFISHGIYTQRDVTFLVDTTADVQQAQFEQVIDFIYNISSQLNIGTNDTMIAMVTFNTDSTIQFDLDDHSDKADLLNAISALKTVSLTGTRNVHTGITDISDNIYTDAGGQRTGAESIVIVILYGESDTRGQDMFSLFGLRPIVDIIYSIGIGDFVLVSTMTQDLSNIATDPDSDHIFYISDFSYLCHYVSNVTIKLDPDISAFDLNGCPEMTTTTTTTTIETTTSEETTSQDTTVTTTLAVTTDELSTSQDITTTTSPATTTDEEVTTTLTEATTTSKKNTIESVNNDSFVLIVAIASVLLMLVVLIAVVIALVYYLPKRRKRKRFENQIILIVAIYPDSTNGLGPSKSRYSDRKRRYKNGYSSKFNAYLKISMMRNGGVNGYLR